MFKLKKKNKIQNNSKTYWNNKIVMDCYQPEIKIKIGLIFSCLKCNH